MPNMLQNKIILPWETLKHFHAICKKHVCSSRTNKSFRDPCNNFTLKFEVGFDLTQKHTSL